MVRTQQYQRLVFLLFFKQKTSYDIRICDWSSDVCSSDHAIWRKMQRKQVAFEQLSDIMAFRVLVESVEDCYRVLGVIHSRYSVVPGRFKDYLDRQHDV